MSVFLSELFHLPVKSTVQCRSIASKKQLLARLRFNPGLVLAFGCSTNLHLFLEHLQSSDNILNGSPKRLGIKVQVSFRSFTSPLKNTFIPFKAGPHVAQAAFRLVCSLRWPAAHHLPSGVLQLSPVNVVVEIARASCTLGKRSTNCALPLAQETPCPFVPRSSFVPV